MNTELTPSAQIIAETVSSLNEFASAVPAPMHPLIATPAFVAGLAAYLTLLAEASRVMNLTSDASPDHLLRTHVRDSLAPLLAGLEPPEALLDIGTGGGFPAVPLALAWPGTSVTMTESIGKKARFLQRLVDGIPLPNARVVQGRVEDAATGLPGHAFSMITARGVAHTATVFHYALPFLTEHGRLILWKGERDLAELEDPPFVAMMRRFHCNAAVAGYALPGIERNSKLVILQMEPASRGQPPRRNCS
jgi:16S rRNA (guanine527-N7)-methyltransferase